MSKSATELLFLILIIAFITIMVAFIILILLFIQKKQKSFVSDLLAVRANYDKELYKAQLEIQEQTFQEIAREIHDNVGQMLSLGKLSLGTIDLDRREEARDSLAEISDILENALDDLRHMSRSMNSETIRKGGLKNAIDMQVRFLRRGGKYNIQFDVQGVPRPLENMKEIIMFRILQEAINNILRHSRASEISIILIYSEDFVKLQIGDNGSGFSMEEQTTGSKSANGIYNMQHRAKLINADFDVASNMGTGTLITVTMPLTVKSE